MNQFVKNSIEKIYMQKEYEYFKRRCKEYPSYMSKLIEAAKDICKSINVCNTNDDPALEVLFDFEKFIQESLCVNYRTVLKISKVSDLFFFQHEFFVDNKDPNRMDPVLSGFSQQAYIFSQNQLEIFIRDFLEKNNLHELNFSEVNEVICNIPIPNDMPIFGKQMTVENALFRDLYEICLD